MPTPRSGWRRRRPASRRRQPAPRVGGRAAKSGALWSCIDEVRGHPGHASMTKAHRMRRMRRILGLWLRGTVGWRSGATGSRDGNEGGLQEKNPGTRAEPAGKPTAEPTAEQQVAEQLRQRRLTEERRTLVKAPQGSKHSSVFTARFAVLPDPRMCCCCRSHHDRIFRRSATLDPPSVLPQHPSHPSHPMSLLHRCVNPPERTP